MRAQRGKGTALLHMSSDKERKRERKFEIFPWDPGSRILGQNGRAILADVS